MKDSVVRFITEQEVALTQREADNFRLVPPGTYSHRTFAYGFARVGITNGLVAYMIWNDGVCREVHWSNLTCQLDPQPHYSGPRAARRAAGAAGAAGDGKPRKEKKTPEQRIEELLADLID